MLRFLVSLTLAATLSPALAEVERGALRSGTIEVPYEVARPRGQGPFPPLLYIHAKRGYDEIDRAYIEQLAARHARERVREWLARHMRLGADGRCR